MQRTSGLPSFRLVQHATSPPRSSPKKWGAVANRRYFSPTDGFYRHNFFFSFSSPPSLPPSLVGRSLRALKSFRSFLVNDDFAANPISSLEVKLTPCRTQLIIGSWCGAAFFVGKWFNSDNAGQYFVVGFCLVRTSIFI